MRMMSFIGATDRAGSGIEMIWSVWGVFYSALPMISESYSPSVTLLILPIEPHGGVAADSSEGKRNVRYGENDVLKCFEASGAELDAGDVMEMLPGISKRSAQKRLKTLLRKGRSPAAKRVALSCTSRSSFRPDARSRIVRAQSRPFAIRSRLFVNRSRFRRIQAGRHGSGLRTRELPFWPPRRPSCASNSGAPATCPRLSCARATWRAWWCPT